MTAQAGEKLVYEGIEYHMASEPLYPYLQANNLSFVSPNTSCWRGYFGSWVIKDDKLFLVGLKAYLKGYKEVELDYLFPGQTEVFADWFSGKLRVPVGKLLDYVHMGYSSMFEEDMYLIFQQGVLKEKRIENNRNKSKNPRLCLIKSLEKLKMMMLSKNKIPVHPPLISKSSLLGRSISTKAMINIMNLIGTTHKPSLPAIVL